MNTRKPRDLGSPPWWVFQSHAAGQPAVPVSVTPLPFGRFDILSSTWIGTFRDAVLGAAVVLAAPWVTRAVVIADRHLIRSLLGPGGLAERVRYLEQTRARAVDDSAALLRQVERDLHDGAQARLAALALNLGMAREKLGAGGDPPDLSRARELLTTAHDGAREALVEIRDLVRVDGRVEVASPAGGPTRITVTLPLRA